MFMYLLGEKEEDEAVPRLYISYIIYLTYCFEIDYLLFSFIF